ncbi:anti-sigma factor [Peteryoungia desertarenae]|uniref:Regulator of SigK n=1 Tax=Peteryoungia desertarenae TaxID=1813451 RepID=A0ABX6QL05_9HYPH|nr:anti-sigma factor [Peteryoungia desertarenae]QLF69238.1 anti-sigma factor [Peteryoungia desertarenae]
MATPDQSKGDRSRDEVLAGEYVLGVLGSDERKRVEARLRLDPSFAAIVRRWEENLSQFDHEYAEVKPPDALFAQIESRIFGDGAKSSLGFWASIWASVVFWRSIGLVSIASLAVFIGVNSAETLRPKPASPPLTADLASTDDAISLVARYEEATGKIFLTPIATGGMREKSLELWVVEGDQRPRSLGILPQTGQGEVDVPTDLRSTLKQGVVLAVSLEPFGGSPTGQATGPVIAAGPMGLSK